MTRKVGLGSSGFNGLEVHANQRTVAKHGYSFAIVGRQAIFDVFIQIEFPKPPTVRRRFEEGEHVVPG